MSQVASSSHPYFPQDAAIPHYVPNTTSLGVILLGFVGSIVLFVASGLYVGKQINPSLRPGHLAAMAWFLLSFFLHAFFEGYFVLYHGSLAASQSLFAQLWKEYALSDSRYMTSDPFMLCIESLTVLVWAPLCLAIVLSIIYRHKVRDMLQIIMCVGHLYGVALYYGTCSFEYRCRGVSHSRPEFLYYWVYYLGLNAAWIVVPAYYLVESFQSVLFRLRLLNSKFTPEKLTTQAEQAKRSIEETEKKTRGMSERSDAMKRADWQEERTYRPEGKTSAMGRRQRRG